MSPNYVLTLALAIGFVAGLRSMTAPAVVSWAANLGRLSLRGTAFSFLGSAAGVGILTVLAAAEYVVDLLPQAPNRTEPASLVVRILTGGTSGACMCVASGNSAMVGAVLGGIGGVVGAFAGFHARMGLVKGMKAPGIVIGIAEDLAAIGLAYLIVFRG